MTILTRRKQFSSDVDIANQGFAIAENGVNSFFGSFRDDRLYARITFLIELTPCEVFATVSGSSCQALSII